MRGEPTGAWGLWQTMCQKSCVALCLSEWPEQVIGRKSPVRGEYLQAIRAADEGDYEPWFELHRRFTASG
jgi:hypothetical protein